MNIVPTSLPTSDLKDRVVAYGRMVIMAYSMISHDVVAQLVGKQLLRAGTSVGANYYEAIRGRSRAEYVAKLGDSIKELSEVIYWLALADSSRLLPSSQLQELLSETEQLLAIFTSQAKRFAKSRPTSDSGASDQS